ncbi:MAG: asparagine synthase-related protein [Thermoanaerobaculia bacterium]|nr:asparagine synthase-related protein [Thermoanaerobaculia bacterium]
MQEAPDQRDNAVFRTDWLASSPVFYNTQTGAISHDVLDVIDPANLEIHPEGFNNYLRFGFSVFQQTPIRHVKLLRHSSSARISPDGRLEIKSGPDITDSWDMIPPAEESLVEDIRRRVRAWEDRVDGEIIVPMTAGYDSRLLCALLRDRSRVRAYTFGRSRRQSQSEEVQVAERLATRIGVRWCHVPLTADHRFFDVWYDLFGPSTNAYHIFTEFFARVREMSPSGGPLLSGIIGDAWAGSVKIPPIQSPSDLLHLGYTRWTAEASMSQFPSRDSSAERFFEENRERLQRDEIRIVEAMRCKLTFLCLLLRIPKYYGFEPWSPFLEAEVAQAMLSLPDPRRRDRRWQSEYFRDAGLDLGDHELSFDRDKMGIVFRLMRQIPRSERLDPAVLREVVKVEYVHWINKMLPRGGLAWDIAYGRRPRRLARVRGLWRIRRALRRRDRRLRAYFAYTLLKPIEKVLRSRSNAS